MKKIILLATSFLMLIAAQVTNAALITDNFNDGVINTALWSVNSNGSVVLTENGGVMNARAPITGNFNIGWLESDLTLTGNFDVSFDYQWINGVGSSRTRTQMWVFNDAESESFQLNFWRGGGSPDGDIQFTHSDGTIIGHSWNPPATGKMRINRSGSAFTAYYWSGSWLSLGSMNGFTGDMHFALNANTAGGSVLDVRWDNVSITADMISSVPVPAALWLFGSGLIGLVGIARRKKA